MAKKFIGVGTLSISKNAKLYVNKTLDRKRLSYGQFTKKFEKKFSSLHQCRFGIMSNSGTSALHIAVAALKEIHNWNNNDEVIVPAVTFVATSNVVVHNSLKPVFVDVEKNFYGIDPELIEDKITDRTKAIIPVHLFGLPCEMDKIKKIAAKYDLRIVEDSCETMFARYKSKMVGSLGDIGCFSTYIAHLITTGVGGINTTNNADYAVMLRSLMNHGRDSIYISIDDSKGKSKKELREVIARRFNFIHLGHSFRATEMEAALGMAQLETWQTMIKKRRDNAKCLIDGLGKFDGRIQLPEVRKGCEHSFMMFPIVLRKEKKQRIVNYLESKSIETREMLPLINQPVYQKLFRIKVSDYPVADWINNNGFYIGCHQDISHGDLDYIIKTFNDFFK
ncbi:DegT/DnrJ/EryC1/StrS family aminotransferase [Candidatus Woesearchaeota archaeon]|nr:DegT/DnrJ/EryC1/StrS family aminotransferase [Candidatus Woesearchaeota archaeon]